MAYTNSNADRTRPIKTKTDSPRRVGRATTYASRIAMHVCTRCIIITYVSRIVQRACAIRIVSDSRIPIVCIRRRRRQVFFCGTGCAVCQCGGCGFLCRLVCVTICARDWRIFVDTDLRVRGNGTSRIDLRVLIRACRILVDETRVSRLNYCRAAAPGDCRYPGTYVPVPVFAGGISGISAASKRINYNALRYLRVIARV